MKYLVEVKFAFTTEIEAESFAEALDNASLGTTLASLGLVQADLGDYYPSDAKILGELPEEQP